MRYRSLIGAACILSMLAGCKTIDSGKVDYRKSDNVASTAADDRKSHRDDCWKKNPTSTELANNDKCSFMLPSPLSDKNYAPGQKVISVGDVYSIRLDHGLIAKLGMLSKVNFDLFREKSQRTHSKGQIVILVNAFEFSDTADGAINKRFLDVLKDNRPSTPSLSEARVVYYSPDVSEQQDLNFSNIPISGPLVYNGRPMGIQIIVLELDGLSASTKSLLKSLANLGKTYIAPSSVNTVLVSLGTSLIDGNSDSVLFEYRMVLDNSANLENQTTPTFTAGRYVFRRAQERTKPIFWQNVRLDENTGALIEFVSEENKSIKQAPFTSDTYFTVNVINHGNTGIVAEYANERWEDTSKKIDAALNDPALQDSQKIQLIDNVAKERVSINTMKAINEATDPAIKMWKDYTAIAKGPVTEPGYETLSDYAAGSPDVQATCKVKWKTLIGSISNNDLSKQKAQLETLRLVGSWKTAATAIPSGDASLRPDEQVVVLRQFTEKVQNALGLIPGDDASLNFADPAKFTSAYLSDEPNALGGILETMADKLKPDVPKTCSALQ